MKTQGMDFSEAEHAADYRAGAAAPFWASDEEGAPVAGVVAAMTTSSSTQDLSMFDEKEFHEDAEHFIRIELYKVAAQFTDRLKREATET